MYKIKEEGQPFELKPRERLMAYGETKLSEQELLAIVLRTGSKEKPVELLAKELLVKFDDLIGFKRASLDELKSVPGIGKIKAIELKAMIELGKRIQSASKQTFGTVSGSESFAQKMMVEMSDLYQEHLVAVYLDNRNRIINKKTVFVGTVNSSLAVPREILYEGVKVLATRLLVVHNHPSDNVTPSQADIEFTKKLTSSCQAMGMNLLDHLVVGQTSYYSFREHDKIK